MMLIDYLCCHYSTLADELHIIEIAVHINAVHYQMQVRNHLGDMVYLMNELIKASLPIFYVPLSCFFLRRGKLKTYGCKFNRLLCILLLKHRLMQYHFVPHAHRRQPLAKMVGLDDVCTIILCCVISHCLTMLNCCCLSYHIMSINRFLMLLHSLMMSLTP